MSILATWDCEICGDRNPWDAQYCAYCKHRQWKLPPPPPNPDGNDGDKEHHEHLQPAARHRAEIDDLRRAVSNSERGGVPDRLIQPMRDKLALLEGD